MSTSVVMHHIRAAEQWLRWARADCRRGDARAAVLRLLLAEAEIRYAREAGMRIVDPPSLPPRRQHLGAAAVGAAAVLFVALGYSVLYGGEGSRLATTERSTRVLGAVPTASTPLGPVQLHSGNLLVLVPPRDGGVAARSSEPWSPGATYRGRPGDLTPFLDLGAPWNAGGRVSVATLTDGHTPGGSF